MSKQWRRKSGSYEKTLMTHTRQQRQLRVLNEMDDVIDEAEHNLNGIISSKYKKAIDIVESFIKKYERVLYGGIAINKLLTTKNDAIYDEDEFPDFDFYTPDYISDSIILCNQLYDAGYKYVRRIPAIHPHTVRVQIDFNIYIADLAYMSYPHIKAIPKVKINGLYYINSEFMKITLYRSLALVKNTYRWKKDITRLNKINKYFPSSVGKNVSNLKVNDLNRELFKYLYDIFIAKKFDRKFMTITGYLAFYIYKLLTDEGFDLNHDEISSYLAEYSPILEFIITDKNVYEFIDPILVAINKFLKKKKLKQKYYVISNTYTGYPGNFLPQKHIIKIAKKSNGSYSSHKDEKELLKEYPVCVIYNYYGMALQYKHITSIGINILNYNSLIHFMYLIRYYIQIKGLQTKFNTFSQVLKQIFYDVDYVDYITQQIKVLNDKFLKKYNMFGYEEKTPNGDPNIFQILQQDHMGDFLHKGLIQSLYVNTPCTTTFNIVYHPVYSPDIEYHDISEYVTEKKGIDVKICLVSDTPPIKKHISKKRSKEVPDEFVSEKRRIVPYENPEEFIEGGSKTCGRPIKVHTSRNLFTDKTSEEKNMYGSFYLINNIELMEKEKDEEDKDEEDEKKIIILYPNSTDVLSYRRIII